VYKDSITAIPSPPPSDKVNDANLNWALINQQEMSEKLSAIIAKVRCKVHTAWVKCGHSLAKSVIDASIGFADIKENV